MRISWGRVMLGLLAVVSVCSHGCATQSRSSTGAEQQPTAERIDEPMIQHIPPPEFSMKPVRTKPPMKAELSAQYPRGTSEQLLSDILFDFDRAVLREDALPMLNENALWLRRRGVSRLLLEGRGDEIGTDSYNLVLGASRAAHVKSYLQELGIVVDLETTSYGKQRPLCFQHDSDCRQMNRSVRFVVKE